jgi:hypothetical protein
MPPKKKQRVRETNEMRQSKQFSTLRKVTKDEEVKPKKKRFDMEGGASSTKSQPPVAVFDPIPNDAMFVIVKDSKYWPPPTVEELLKSKGLSSTAIGEGLNSDGMDTYDRRGEAPLPPVGQKRPRQSGEINHPRGKANQNQKLTFDDEQ